MAKYQFLSKSIKRRRFNVIIRRRLKQCISRFFKKKDHAKINGWIYQTYMDEKQIEN